MIDLLSAARVEFLSALAHHLELDKSPDLMSPLDLIGCDSFKDYLYWCTSQDYISAYCLNRLRDDVRAKDAMYWRVNEVKRIVCDLPGLKLFSSQRNQEVSSFLWDWTHWLRKPESFGVFCEYNAFMSMWSEKHSLAKARPGRLFLEVVFGYVYNRVGTELGELSPRSVAYNS